MAKRGQHNDDARDQDKSRGQNNPSKSVTITAGTPKKKDTYRKQALAHEDPGKQPQAARNEWEHDTRDPRRQASRTRARQGDLDAGRNGSDSNANASAGMNDGPQGPHPEKTARTAYDLKALHRRLQDFPDDQLKQIPVLPEGSRLQQGATYVDLHAADPEEFRATAEMVAGPANWFAPKDSVPYPLWNEILASWKNNG